MPELLIGCGSRRAKDVWVANKTEWTDLRTLDINADHKPDVVHDLNDIPLPFADDTFDEVHAYEVLEHVGQQGDYKFFFTQFADIWRILKPTPASSRRRVSPSSISPNIPSRSARPRSPIFATSTRPISRSSSSRRRSTASSSSCRPSSRRASQSDAGGSSRPNGRSESTAASNSRA